MKHVLVTGGDGFVGAWLVPALAAAGWRVTATRRPGGGATPAGDVRWRDMELADAGSVLAAASEPVDAVVHLAAVSSGAEARRDPGTAWVVNAAGTARLLAALEETRRREGTDPLVLLVSSGEVYGAGRAVPRAETDPVAPQSPYAASKAAAELAALECHRRGGVRVVIARAFQHTGPGQAPAYVVPALAARLAEARTRGAREVPVGNLEPVRDIMDVRDVVTAYLALLGAGKPGGIYNVASGHGIALSELFRRLAALTGADARPVPDPALQRPADIPHLVGDTTLLRSDTGWRPAYSLDQTLRDVIDAQAH